MIEKQIQEYEEKQKSYAKAYLILCLILLISLGTYSIFKAREYITLKTGLDTNGGLIEVLKTDVTAEKAAYEINKTKTDLVISEIDKKLKTIFPDSDDYTNLTRQIDKIEEDLNKIGDPFEISNIDYLNISTDGKFSILPLRMNIVSSGENFTKFLHLVENSGALDEGRRLMDISSIRLSFQESEDKSEKNNLINFSVLINAYFQSGK